MKQRSIPFTAPQLEWLSEQSKSIGISFADLVRRIIDEKRLAQKRIEHHSV